MDKTASPNRAVAWLAVLAGIAMASNYVLQPLLPAVARSFPTAPWVESFVAAAGPFGYVIGLLFLVPLGDGISGRTLILWQSLGLCVALVAAAWAPIAWMLILACAAGGAMATVTAQCIALAGRVYPERPGLAVGGVVMGVSIGILAGRVGGGAVGQWLGWRAPLQVLSVGLLAVVALIGRSAPQAPVLSKRLKASDLLLSAPRAFRKRPSLLRATLVGCCWFAAFSAFWSSLALHLTEPPFGFGGAEAGAFGVLGIVGAIMARTAGQAADRVGARLVVFAGLTIAAAGFILLAATPHTLTAIIIATLLLDAGCFSAHAATQANILQTTEADRSQAYAAYMVVYWAAGTAGAFAGPWLFTALGWRGLSIFEAALILIGLCLHAKRHHLADGRTTPTLGASRIRT